MISPSTKARTAIWYALSKNRIATDPAFARTRENGNEFANVAKSGKHLRNALTGLMSNAKDNRVTSRLTQVLSKVKNHDLLSVRGERNVANGIATPEGKAILKGFDFNSRARMASVLLNYFSVDTTTGEVVLTNLNPAEQVHFPEGTTHFSLQSGFLRLNFDQPDNFNLQLSPETSVPIDAAATTITLTPAGPTIGTGESYFFLKISFFQEINGIQYLLKNGAHNALQLIEIE